MAQHQIEWVHFQDKFPNGFVQDIWECKIDGVMFCEVATRQGKQGYFLERHWNSRKNYLDFEQAKKASIVQARADAKAYIKKLQQTIAQQQNKIKILDEVIKGEQN